MKLHGEYPEFSEVDAKQTQSAKTCYRKKIDYESDAKDELNSDLLVAGHHSTIGHQMVNLKITTSRLHTFTVLHAHPHYTSDERSQRYTEIGPKNFYSFNDSELDQHNKRCSDFYQSIFQELLKILEEPCKKRFKSRAQNYLPNIAKERARMVLPFSTRTNLWHSVNPEVLLQYVQFKSLELPCQNQFVELLLDKVISNSSTMHEYFTKQSEAADYQDLLPDFHDIPVLNQSSFPIGNGKELKEALINHRGPLKGITRFGRLGKFLSAESIRGNYLMSAAGLAQLQRHRPLKMNMTLHHGGFYTDEYLELSKYYKEFLEYIQSTIPKVQNHHLRYYFYPVGQLFRFSYEITPFDFINLASKRICFNAQSEISQFAYDVTSDAIRQISEPGSKTPLTRDDILTLFAPPCHHNERYGIKPRCPEGKRYCGVPAWKVDHDDLMEARIV